MKRMPSVTRKRIADRTKISVKRATVHDVHWTPARQHSRQHSAYEIHFRERQSEREIRSTSKVATRSASDCRDRDSNSASRIAISNRSRDCNYRNIETLDRDSGLRTFPAFNAKRMNIQVTFKREH